jgi:hypothetical protein
VSCCNKLAQVVAISSADTKTGNENTATNKTKIANFKKPFIYLFYTKQNQPFQGRLCG